MDFLQTVFKTNIFLWPCSYQIKRYANSPEFDASYDPIVTKSKGMQKSPEFDATISIIVTKSKGMQKKSKIWHNIWPHSYQIKSYAKKSRFWRKLMQSSDRCSKLYFYSKRFRFAPSLIKSAAKNSKFWCKIWSYKTRTFSTSNQKCCKKTPDFDALIWS